MERTPLEISIDLANYHIEHDDFILAYRALDNARQILRDRSCIAEYAEKDMFLYGPEYESIVKKLIEKLEKQPEWFRDSYRKMIEDLSEPIIKPV